MFDLGAQLLAFNSEELQEKVFPKNVIKIGSFAVNDSVISGFIVVAVVLIVALILRLTIIRKWKTTPTGGQMFLEWLVSFFDKSADEMTENYSGLMGPYTLGAAAYIFCGVLIELFGLRPAIADVCACLSLALCSFIFIHTLGFVRNRHRRLKHYLNPINVITDLAVPVSMTFRLFGSILSGMVIMDLIYIIVESIWYFGVPVVVAAALTPVFTLFHAVIQAYVFASLTLTFVSEAIEPVPRKQKKPKKRKGAETAKTA